MQLKHVLAISSSFIIASSLYPALPAYASGLEWDNTSFYNPTLDAVDVKKWQVTVYDTIYDLHESYQGSITVPDPILGPVTSSGYAFGHTRPTWLTGSVFYRFSPQAVGVVTLNKPYAVDSLYPNNSLIAAEGTASYLDTWDVGPSIIYFFNEKFSVIVGADLFNVRRAQLANMIFPASLNLKFANILDSNWTLGFHVGAAMQLAQGTFLSIIYFTPKSITLNGKTTLGPTVVSPNVTTRVHFPSDTTAQLIQYINEKWRLELIAEFVPWSVDQSITFENGVAPGVNYTLPLNYKNTVTWTLSSSYDITPKLELTAALTFDPNWVRSTSGTGTTGVNSPLIPGLNTYWLTLMADYDATDFMKVELGYTHVYLATAGSTGISATTGNVLNGTSSAYSNDAWIGLTFHG